MTPHAINSALGAVQPNRPVRRPSTSTRVAGSSPVTTSREDTLVGVRRKLYEVSTGLGSLSGRPFDTRIQIPHGEAGTAATIKEMSRQAVLGSRDPIIRLLAYELIDGIRGRDHEAVAKRFFYWLQDHGSGEKSGLKFINDPYRTEQVRAPWWAIFIEGAGDCNSGFSTSLAALLMSVGIPCFFRTVAADSSRPDSFSHVYTVALVRGRELPLDASVSFSSPGSEPSEITRKKDWRINVFDEDDRNSSGGGFMGWLRRLAA